MDRIFIEIDEKIIALGGAIGTGLFLGISQSIKLAGPSVILGYAIAGFIA
ncbi:hypothetical protein IAF46_16135, partial [Acinetobacter baumannii]|nr:hypothetical protein [Acinetobacter baumannii]